MNDQQPNLASVGWGTIVIIYLLCVLAASSISQVVPIVGDVARFFHATRPQVGWIISIPSAVVAIGALFIGWVVDRLGDKILILLGTVLLILGDLGAVLANSINILLLMRILEGVGYCFVAVSTVTMIARVTSGKRRTAALTLWSSFIPMSFAIPLALAGLLTGTGHWRWAFAGHAAAMLVLGVAAIGLPRHARLSERRSRRGAANANLLCTRRLLRGRSLCPDRHCLDAAADALEPIRSSGRNNLFDWYARYVL
jgi:MFS family permease